MMCSAFWILCVRFFFLGICFLVAWSRLRNNNNNISNFVNNKQTKSIRGVGMCAGRQPTAHFQLANKWINVFRKAVRLQYIATRYVIVNYLLDATTHYYIIYKWDTHTTATEVIALFVVADKGRDEMHTKNKNKRNQMHVCHVATGIRGVAIDECAYRTAATLAIHVCLMFVDTRHKWHGLSFREGIFFGHLICIVADRRWLSSTVCCISEVGGHSDCRN